MEVTKSRKVISYDTNYLNSPLGRLYFTKVKPRSSLYKLSVYIRVTALPAYKAIHHWPEEFIQR